MATTDVKSLSKASLPKAIETCKKMEAKCKDNEVKKKKYQDMRKTFEKAQETLKKAIEATNSIKLNGSEKTFYQEFIDGKEDAVTLAWLGAKLSEQRNLGHIAGGKIPETGDDMSVEFKYDFIDRTKKVCKDFTGGKGIAKGLATGAVGVLIAELLTKGATNALVQHGILESSMGLIGLGKLGIKLAPTAWQALTGAATALVGWSPVVCVAAGAFVALKTIPMIKKAVDSVKKKHKEAGAFDEEMKKLMAEQKVME